ncbi:MAG: DEAD/DEAH box helicase [Pirellulaceae bacterium]
MPFESMNLLAPLQRVLAEQRYEIPTPIQSQTIPAALAGQDILGCAQTGTGKTAAFALPTLDYLGREKLPAKRGRPLVLVLAPTRELAIQIDKSFRIYGKYLSVRQALVYGGVSQVKQVASLRKGAHILIATPGRLVDLMEQQHIDLRDIEILILDEADRMLDMGFLPQLKQIIARLPRERQSLFFSATMPPRIRDLSKQLLFNPSSVNVTPKRPSLELIEQRVVMVDKSNKLSTLRNLLKKDSVERAIVFTRTKRGANLLAKKLDAAGFRTAAIHGNKSQGARQKALEAFRQRHVTVLVATDVASRGIDIDGITHVINYDMPMEPESYVHRIGRTGRAGADGMAVSLCTSGDRAMLRSIERLIRKQLPVVNNSRDDDRRSADRDGASPAGSRRGRSRRSYRGANGNPRGSRSSRPTTGKRRKSRPAASHSN